MAKAAAATGGKTDENSTNDAATKAADDAPAAAAGSTTDDAGKTDDAAGAAKPAKKAEKTFSKAEQDAAVAKAVSDAQEKWEAEKDLSELERVKKENEDLRNSNRLRDAKDEVVSALTAAGNKSPELAFNAIRGELKFDDNGKLINSKDLIEGLKTGFPEQFGEAKPNETIDGGAGQGDKGGLKLTKEVLEKMTPAEINKLDWADVSKVLAEK